MYVGAFILNLLMNISHTMSLVFCRLSSRVLWQNENNKWKYSVYVCMFSVWTIWGKMKMEKSQHNRKPKKQNTKGWLKAFGVIIRTVCVFEIPSTLN